MSAAGLGSDGAELSSVGENAIFRLAGDPIVVRIARPAGSPVACTGPAGKCRDQRPWFAAFPVAVLYIAAEICGGE
jgi:hypothetical protein